MYVYTNTCFEFLMGFKDDAVLFQTCELPILIILLYKNYRLIHCATLRVRKNMAQHGSTHMERRQRMRDNRSH